MIFLFLLLSVNPINKTYAFPHDSQGNIQISIPADEDVLIPLTTEKSTAPTLPQTMTLITWNVLKGEKGEQWAEDMNQLAQSVDIFALQEAMDDNFMPKLLEQIEGFSFILARSFMYDDGRSTGVSTGSRALPIQTNFRRSPGREPILNTPKMTILTTYQMADGQQLLVLNLHGINFVTSTHLKNQLEDLREIISEWNGRIIFLGDFNTWNSSRLDILTEFTSSLEFSHVTFSPDPREKVLDHVFLRGCIPLESKVLNEIKSSDHKPLAVKIHCG